VIRSGWKIFFPFWSVAILSFLLEKKASSPPWRFSRGLAGLAMLSQS